MKAHDPGPHAHTSVIVDSVTGVEFDQERILHVRERGDLLLIRRDERLLIDVTIVTDASVQSTLTVIRRGPACAAAVKRGC